MTPLDSLTVGIVVFETDERLLRACLASVESEFAALSARCEVIVVDNSSTTSLRDSIGTDRVAKWHMTGKNAGFAVAANHAVALATGSYVLLLNPDAELAPGSLAELLSASRHESSPSLLCGWLENGAGPQVDALMHWWSSTGRLVRRRSYQRYLSDAQQNNEPVAVQKVSGGALWGATSLLAELGPFDQSFFLYGEDVDLSVRARAQGIKLLASPRARVSHVGASSQASFSTLVERARVDASIRVASKHLSYPFALLVRLDLFVVTMIGLLPGLKTSSGTREARRARVLEIRRWGLSRWRPKFDPER